MGFLFWSECRSWKRHRLDYQIAIKISRYLYFTNDLLHPWILFTYILFYQMDIFDTITNTALEYYQMNDWSCTLLQIPHMSNVFLRGHGICSAVWAA